MVNQRYEILYKHNEFLQEYVGRDMKVLNTSGKELSNSSTMRDITRRILKEHWKHADVPVSPAKVVIWSNDKEGYIKQISASHLIWDKKEKIVFSDLINQNFGNMMSALYSYFGSGTKTAAIVDDGAVSNVMNIIPNGAASWFNAGAVNEGLIFKVGKGTQAGNLRTVSTILTPFTVAPENGYLSAAANANFSSVTGLVTNGTSFSSGEIGTITEVVTGSTLVNNVGIAKNCIYTYDIVSFGMIVAQLVNLAFVIQL